MNKTKQLWLLTVLAVLGVFVSGYFLLISPKAKDAGEVRRDVATAESTNRSLEQQIAMLKTQAKQLPKEQARLAELARKIPNNMAQPSLVRALSDLADSTGSVLGGVAFVKPTSVVAPLTVGPQPSASPAAGAPTVARPTTPTPTLAILPVEISVTGTFAGIQEYLAGLEELQRAFLVTAFDIKPRCRPEDGGRPADDCVADSILLELKGRVFLTTQQSANRPVTVPASTEGN